MKSDYHKAWREANPERFKKHQEDYKTRNRDAINKKNRSYYQRNKGRYLAHARLTTEKNKKALVEKFGGKCALCGYDDDYRALQVDHKNGGGNKHRRQFTSSLQYVKYLLSYEGDEFQLLCANCNWIKRYENKELQPL